MKKIALVALIVGGCSSSESKDPAVVSGNVTVVVYDDGAPLVGADVVFHDAEGRALATAVTGADGTVSGDASMVTVARVVRGERRLDTVMGLEADDHIVIGSPDVRLATMGAARITAASGVENAGSYFVSVGCNDTIAAQVTAPVDLAVDGACVGASGTVSALAVARTQDGTPWSYAIAKSAWSEGDSKDLVLGPWSAEWGDTFVTMGPFADGASIARMNVGAVADGVTYWGVSTGQGMPAYPGSFSSCGFGYPKALADSFEYVVAVGYEASDSVIVGRDSAMPQNNNLDAADLFPAIASVTKDASDPKRPRLTWTDDAAFATADAFLAEVRFSGDAVARWTVLAPSDARDIRLPALPGSLASWTPGASEMGAATIAFVDADHIADFAEVRNEYGPSVLESRLPSDARVRFVLGYAP